jgi:hypothetical protein
MCSGIRRCVVWWLFFDVSKGYIAFTCKVKTPLKVRHEICGIVNSERNQVWVEGFSPNNVKMHVIYFVNYSFWLIRGRQDGLPNRNHLLTSWHGVIFQNTWIFAHCKFVTYIFRLIANVHRIWYIYGLLARNANIYIILHTSLANILWNFGRKFVSFLRYIFSSNWQKKTYVAVSFRSVPSFHSCNIFYSVI